MSKLKILLAEDETDTLAYEIYFLEDDLDAEVDYEADSRTLDVKKNYRKIKNYKI